MFKLTIWTFKKKPDDATHGGIQDLSEMLRDAAVPEYQQINILCLGFSFLPLCY